MDRKWVGVGEQRGMKSMEIPNEQSCSLLSEKVEFRPEYMKADKGTFFMMQTNSILNKYLTGIIISVSSNTVLMFVLLTWSICKEK